MPGEKTLILCAGLQSSGTTLISYCFLQRGDTDGVLDAENDVLPTLDPSMARPFAWCKTTIGCFRLSEMAEHYRDAGWDVRKLLVLRDLRAVWASLRTKHYGRNGTTAEDPPLRMRIRRFIEDWQDALHDGTALLRYEDFVQSPENALQQACAGLGLPWEPAMVTWPKALDQIAEPKNGNETFWNSRGSDLMQTLARYQEKPAEQTLPAADLQWLESEFREFNEASGYPPHWDAASQAPSEACATADPSFEVTRRREIMQALTSGLPDGWLTEISSQLSNRNRDANKP